MDYATLVLNHKYRMGRSTAFSAQILQKNEIYPLEWGGFRAKIGFFQKLEQKHRIHYQDYTGRSVSHG